MLDVLSGGGWRVERRALNIQEELRAAADDQKLHDLYHDDDEQHIVPQRNLQRTIEEIGYDFSDPKDEEEADDAEVGEYGEDDDNDDDANTTDGRAWHEAHADGRRVGEGNSDGETHGADQLKHRGGWGDRFGGAGQAAEIVQQERSRRVDAADGVFAQPQQQLHQEEEEESLDEGELLERLRVFEQERIMDGAGDETEDGKGDRDIAVEREEEVHFQRRYDDDDQDTEEGVGDAFQE